MQLLLKNSPTSYETGDTIIVKPDGEPWGSIELNKSKFTIIEGVSLTDADSSYLTMADETFHNVSAISQIGAFRHALFHTKNLVANRKRKYIYENGVVKKP